MSSRIAACAAPLKIENSKFKILLYVLCVLCGKSFSLDRNAFTFTRYDLQLRVDPAEHALGATGRLTLRNDSPLAQRVLTLQISSTLTWQSITVAGKRVQYIAEQYTTDIDHTGAVAEAIVTLPHDVPPQGTVELQIAYAGTVPLDATRLTRIGAPKSVAEHSDWDEISTAFTGVRGVGHVCWYPVSIESASLSQGSRVFQAIGAWSQRHAASSMMLTLSVASDHTLITNGRLLGQKAQAGENGTVQQRDYEFNPIGLTPPSFFVSEYTVLSRPAINVFHVPSHQGTAAEYALAAEKDLPFITEWFGPPREKVTVVEIPEGDAPFESGAMYFAPLSGRDRRDIEVAVAHPLAHASFTSPRPWISEGLAHFAQALVRERQDGRKAAIAYMQSFQPALADAEKQALSGETGTPEGQPLIRATDEVFYRAKAMFVWWMLRDMLGEQPLEAALHAYRAADDKEPSYLQRLLQAQSKRPLEWFFDDWVYRDRGLPDFRIAAANVRALLEGSFTVTVSVENRGAAAAEVPVLVPVEAGQAQRRVVVPAHGQAAVLINVPSAPEEVTVNDGSVPESDSSNNVFKLPKPQ